MKNLFKMMVATVLTFNVSGCAEYIVAEAVLATAQAISESSNNSSSYVRTINNNSKTQSLTVSERKSNAEICNLSTDKNYITKEKSWKTHSYASVYIKAAKQRGLKCGVKDNESKNTYASLKNKKSKRQILNDIARETKKSFKNVKATKLNSGGNSSTISFISRDGRFSLKFDVDRELIHFKPQKNATSSKNYKYY